MFGMVDPAFEQAGLIALCENTTGLGNAEADSTQIGYKKWQPNGNRLEQRRRHEFFRRTRRNERPRRARSPWST